MGARAEAKAEGRTRYEGLACLRCASTLRYTSGGDCVECENAKKLAAYHRKVGPIALRKCKRCEIGFQPANRSQLFCSKLCASRFSYQACRVPRPKTIGVCLECCGVFEKITSRHKYCSEFCRQKSFDEYRNEKLKEANRKGRIALLALEELGIKIEI